MVKELARGIEAHGRSKSYHRRCVLFGMGSHCGYLGSGGVELLVNRKCGSRYSWLYDWIESEVGWKEITPTGK